MTAHRQAGLSRLSQSDKPFLEISIYLIEQRQYITGIYIYMKQGGNFEHKLLVKSYGIIKKCT